MPPVPSSPFALRNVRLFILFRLFFVARFYYPVFTVLFLDLGLSLEQFTLLNVVWAISIIVLEVPSGALADTLGRRNLLRVTGALMIVEMILLCFATVGGASVLFGVLLANRILSGAAEAAASGADEALAYDTLSREGNSSDWPRVLEMQMRIQSAGFIVSSLVGAAVYDVEFMQWLADQLRFNIAITSEHTLRLPPALCLVMAVATFSITMKMEDTEHRSNEGRLKQSWWRTSVEAGRLTLRAGNWILKNPYPLVLIVAGLVFDSTIRMFLTLNSQYYRIIDFPEASFGVIGSALSFVGLVMPTVARQMTERYSMRLNFTILSCLTWLGLIALTWVIPYWGLLSVVPLFVVMYLLGFFMSHYLNLLTPSIDRATILSFKGLAFNLGYGLVGLLYAGLISILRPGIAPSCLAPEDALFVLALPWFPRYFAVILVALALFAWGQMRLRRGVQRLDIKP